MAAPAMEADYQVRDWRALPPGVLSRIFRKASTSQTPGYLLASLVCRTWRSAAVPSSGMCLLYHAGQPVSDHTFSTFVQHHSHHIVALSLQHSNRSGVALQALMQAATAAAAAGRPLQLHTLRVLGCGLYSTYISQLLAVLPKLRCLQAKLGGASLAPLLGRHPAASSGGLVSLPQATQLQELYLTGPEGGRDANTQALASALPVSLQRLSWTPPAGCTVPPLTHLTQLSFLQLQHWHRYDLSNKLPCSLRHLEVFKRGPPGLELPPEQWHEAVAAFGECRSQHTGDLPTLFNLCSVTGTASCVESAAMGAALEQLSDLSALTVHVEVILPTRSAAAAAAAGGGPAAAVAAAPVEDPMAYRPPRTLHGLWSTAQRLSSLQRLHLDMANHHARTLPDPAGLSELAGLRQLRLTLRYTCSIEQHRAWAGEIGRIAGLQRLSVPDLLLEGEQAWLGGLQQLRVLALYVAEIGGEPLRMAAFNIIRMQWAQGTSPCQQPLPPCLQVLGWSGMTAAQAAAWGLRRRLQQRLGSSRCEVVLGFDLDQLADPAQQMAGLPAALQQALG